MAPEPRELEVPGPPVIRGQLIGEGPTIVLLHGITATHRQVLHGSVALTRAGYRLLSFDARGHGASDPSPEVQGYTYDEMAADALRVIEEHAPEERVIIVGHSMGCHTAANLTLAHPDRVRAGVFMGPVSSGRLPPLDVLEGWDRLADGLESGGVEGFMDAFDRNIDPAWREPILRFTRERMESHHHPDAVAQAMRQVPRSVPFDGLEALAAIDAPALVVASHDRADPGHPRAVAESWAQSIPGAKLTGEDEGEAPLVWRGGLLSRAIADFLKEAGFVGPPEEYSGGS